MFFPHAVQSLVLDSLEVSSSEEISHGKSRGPKKIKHRWTPKENGLPKKVPKKPLEFSKTWPPRSTVTEKWRYVKSRKSTQPFPHMKGYSSPEKTLSTCTPKKNSWNLFSFSSTSFFVSSFCRLLEGKHRSQH